MESAIPISRSTLLSSLKEVTKQPEPKPEDKAVSEVAGLKHNAGYKHLEKRIKEQISQIKQFPWASKDNITVTEIGLRTLAAEMAVSLLEENLAYVDLCKKYIDER